MYFITFECLGYKDEDKHRMRNLLNLHIFLDFPSVEMVIFSFYKFFGLMLIAVSLHVFVCVCLDYS